MGKIFVGKRSSIVRKYYYKLMLGNKPIKGGGERMNIAGIKNIDIDRD